MIPQNRADCVVYMDVVLQRRPRIGAEQYSLHEAFLENCDVLYSSRPAPAATTSATTLHSPAIEPLIVIAALSLCLLSPLPPLPDPEFALELEPELELDDPPDLVSASVTTSSSSSAS